MLCLVGVFFHKVRAGFCVQTGVPGHRADAGQHRVGQREPKACPRVVRE